VERILQTPEECDDNNRALRPERLQFDDKDRDLRPQRMEDMVGQREVFARLKSPSTRPQNGTNRWDISSSMVRRAWAKRLSPCVFPTTSTSAPKLPVARSWPPQNIIPYLTNAEERSVLFIDEIHRLPKTVEEFLYPRWRTSDRLDPRRRSERAGHQHAAKPFTLIGATTRTGLLSAPLRDRFQMREHLDFLLGRRLGRDRLPQFEKLQVEIDADAAKEIAGRSRGTPRLANNRLRWVRIMPRARPTGRFRFPSPARPWRCKGSTCGGSILRI